MKLRQQYLEASEVIRKKIKVPLQVRKDKNDLERWLIKTEGEIAELEMDIESAKGKETFNADAILDLADDLNLKERRLKQGNALMLELFTEETPLMEKLQESKNK